MKLFHTADWHLGKLLHNVYMTEDQRHVLMQFADAVAAEKPDAVIIAGDLYDRAVPPAEAVDLLDDILRTIVLDLRTPVLAIAGNHDSPSRLQFGSHIMKAAGCHIAGEFQYPFEAVTLYDEHGPVHFYLVPYADPAVVRHRLEDETIRSHDDAMKAIIDRIKETMQPDARHVLVGHAFVTPHGEAQRNTSDAERPLAIGGAEHVSAEHFAVFQYTALGHLHQAHHVGHETIRYAGSPLKYSISEEFHQKGFLVVELDAQGVVAVEKRPLVPRRDVRTVEGRIADIERGEKSEDYVFVRLLDEQPVISPMARVRAVYPNAMHVERQPALQQWTGGTEIAAAAERAGADMLTLFRTFYLDAKGQMPTAETEQLFLEAMRDVEREEGERHEADQADDDGVRTV